MYSLVFTVLVGCASAPPAPPRPESAPVGPERAEALLQVLLTLGVDYRNGGNTPASGFDCSGLVAHVFREAYGIRLPHNARAQSEVGARVSPVRGGSRLYTAQPAFLASSTSATGASSTREGRRAGHFEQVTAITG
jgi:cell wall-associated NlpC family hydrolase